jgi:hypothetical protein
MSICYSERNSCKVIVFQDGGLSRIKALGEHKCTQSIKVICFQGR